MVCGSHFRGNLQITPGGHSPEEVKSWGKRIKVNCGPFNVAQSQWEAGWGLGIRGPRHRVMKLVLSFARINRGRSQRRVQSRRSKQFGISDNTANGIKRSSLQLAVALNLNFILRLGLNNGKFLCQRKNFLAASLHLVLLLSQSIGKNQNIFHRHAASSNKSRARSFRKSERSIELNNWIQIDFVVTSFPLPLLPALMMPRRCLKAEKYNKTRSSTKIIVISWKKIYWLSS